MWYIWIAILIVYVGVTWWSLLEASAPTLSCHEPSSTGASPHSSLSCFRPAVRVGDQFTIQLQLFLRPDIENADAVMEQSTSRRAKHFPRWVPVDTCRIDLVVPETGKLPKLVTSASDSKVGEALEKGDTNNVTKSDASQQCEVLLPAIARHRSNIQSEVQPLEARFVLLETTPTDKVDEAADDGNQMRRYTSVIGTMTPFFLTRVQKREPRSMMRLLLEAGSTTIKTTPSNQDSTSSGTNESILESNDSDHSDSDPQNNSTMWIPYIKFGRSPIRIRFVAEDRGYAMLNRADGIGLQALNSSFSAPMVYVDELSLQQSAHICSGVR